ncbi:DUF1090 domain-containing protein [Paramixta manurensis]|uniref:DUF1090 domain-containing protein n=1 Tax=Paramixta manurensis TaxID=2740817 RepID=A0A6M8UDG4_9GAMM|nr:DUF1090 domain-containing protein [Erwiniaceae bacterium PD-1]
MKPRYMLCSVLLVLPGLAQAAETLCMQKEKDIQHEIQMAQQHDNQRRVNGLERALTEVRASCTDAKLKAAHQERIEAKQKEVAEREQDLKEAKEKGDKDKIAKRERKLQEERDELKQLQAAPW